MNPVSTFKALSFGGLLLASSGGALQPPPCPRPALARLMTLAGRWSADWSYLVDGQLRAVEGAVATIDIAAGECGIRERLEGHLQGRPLAVTTLIAASPDDSLQRVYIDSEHGTVLLFSGGIIGDTVRFLWRRDLGTRQQVVRHDYTAVTPSSFATETYMSPNGGGEWLLVQRARYRRVTE